ncbi:MAG: hypothetical protein H6629_11860 [Calditrichae bacterium]|nr:hypothetical protein [Calditrichia bacterium]
MNNSQLQMIKSKNEAIETKIKDLLSKSFRNTEENRNNYILSFRDSPELGVKYLRLTREVEIQNKIFQFLTQQYEEAKVMEAKDSPIIQILDSPNFPTRNTHPKDLLYWC